MDNEKYLNLIESFVNNKITCGMMTYNDAILFAHHMLHNQGIHARSFKLEEAEFEYYVSHGSFEGFPYNPFEQVTITTVM